MVVITLLCSNSISRKSNTGYRKPEQIYFLNVSFSLRTKRCHSKLVMEDPWFLIFANLILVVIYAGHSPG